MAAVVEAVFGTCFSRFLFSRGRNYQDLLKASNFPQKTLRSMMGMSRSLKKRSWRTQWQPGSHSLPGQIDRTQILGPTVLMLLGQTPSGQCETSSQFLQVIVKAQRGSVISFTDTTSLPARV